MSEERIKTALQIAMNYGGFDGGHHKMWVIDQMVRALTGCPIIIKKSVNWNGEPYEFECLGESKEYKKWIKKYCNGEDGPKTYEWDEGIAP